MKNVTFKSIIHKMGTRTVIVLPFDPHAIWGMKKRHDVNGTINAYAYRGPVRNESDCFYLNLGLAWCRDTDLYDGAPVDVILTAEGPQVELLATDISGALQNDQRARAFFESLPTFYRKNYIRWIERAKRPETRQMRIGEMIRLLVLQKREK